ncbi:hypothetical protein [Sporosarcina limicola]|uniref:NADPH-dependent 7-cyano-7-deazaguanine reductase QueF-like protein n=1 Tax=Sporosarcina limicola TaxID=34101 RepID=A0A927MLV2_9BACL|nr:hypothetical protein [Sporosarcina limicola]MBE1557120.1 NADPH-dependent 7-cyano-7-deazaguanine reductase QueF-like protein [Sporosarcina limicola]
MKQGITMGILLVAVLILAGSVFVLSGEKSTLKDTVGQKDQKIQALKGKVDELSAVTGLQVTGEEVRFIEQTFHVYLNYDNESYVTRFEELSNLVKVDVLNKLKGASSLAPPVVAMKNELESVQVYINPSTPHTFLVYTTTSYFLDGALVNHGSQLYEVSVLQNNGQFLIGDIKVIGNMTEVDGV